MSNLDGRAAWILLTALLLTAVIGFEQGLVRALAAAKEATPSGAPGADADREPVPRAQPLSAAPLDEAAVRQIARQEADAAIARARPKKAQPAADADASPVVSLDSSDPADAGGGKLVMATPPAVSLHPATPSASRPAGGGGSGGSSPPQG